MKKHFKNNLIKNINILALFFISSHASFALEEVSMIYGREEEVFNEKQKLSEEAPNKETTLSHKTDVTQDVPKKESRIFIPSENPLSHRKPSEVEESGKSDIAKEERFEDIRERSNKISALGSAMGAIDLGSTPPNKIRIGAGIGDTSTSQAVAIGVGYAPTENLKLNTKVSTSTDSTSNRGISVGASYDLNLW